MEDHLLAFLQGDTQAKFLLVQDNCFSGCEPYNCIDVLPLSPCSPHMKPVENLWSILVRRVDAENRQFRAIEDLRVALLEVWDGVQEDIHVCLVGSQATRRVFELLTGRGGSSRY